MSKYNSLKVGIKKLGEKLKKTRQRSRNWCFTDFEIVDFGTMYKTHKDIIRYICWGEETCPKTKKTHLQGWIQMMNPKDFGVIKRLLGAKTHIECAKGSEFENDKYCKKEGKYISHGKFKSQGQRSDLEDIKKTLENGGTMLNIANSHFSDYIRYHSGFEKFVQLVQKESTRAFRNVHVTVHTGTTGTGKTRRAVEADADHYMIRGDDLQWFDGYTGEKTLIIDEYSNQVPITKLLSLLDGYQLRLPIKGGFTYAQWNKVYITTNLELLHTQAKSEHYEALERRIDEVLQFGSHEVTEG